MQEVECHILSVGNTRYSEKFKLINGATGSPTITLIISQGKSLLVDPGYGPYESAWLNALQEARKLKESLSKVLGKTEADVIFVTHLHNDHCNLAGFFSSPITNYSYRKILPGVTCFATPGHYSPHYSLEIKTKEGIVVVAGDAVINKNYFYAKNPWERIYRANGYDIRAMEQTNKTMNKIGKRADYIIPGHGDKFKVK